MGRANGQTVHPQDASTRERTSGAPLAAMHPQLTLSVCKRRDAVRLALKRAGSAGGRGIRRLVGCYRELAGRRFAGRGNATLTMLGFRPCGS